MNGASADGGSIVFVGAADGNKLDLLAAKIQLQLIAALEAQLGGVRLADEQVAVDLDEKGGPASMFLGA